MHALDSSGDEPEIKVTDESFKCITEMTKVRHFYVDNLETIVEAAKFIPLNGEQLSETQSTHEGMSG